MLGISSWYRTHRLLFREHFFNEAMKHIATVVLKQTNKQGLKKNVIWQDKPILHCCVICWISFQRPSSTVEYHRYCSELFFFIQQTLQCEGSSVNIMRYINTALYLQWILFRFFFIAVQDHITVKWNSSLFTLFILIHLIQQYSTYSSLFVHIHIILPYSPNI